MPRGPKGEKRPADVIGNAVHVMRIATETLPGLVPACSRAYYPGVRRVMSIADRICGHACGPPMRIGGPMFSARDQTVTELFPAA